MHADIAVSPSVVDYYRFSCAGSTLRFGCAHLSTLFRLSLRTSFTVRTTALLLWFGWFRSSLCSFQRLRLFFHRAYVVVPLPATVAVDRFIRWTTVGFGFGGYFAPACPTCTAPCTLQLPIPPPPTFGSGTPDLLQVCCLRFFRGYAFTALFTHLYHSCGCFTTFLRTVRFGSSHGLRWLISTPAAIAGLTSFTVGSPHPFWFGAVTFWLHRYV
jgi:hypothetical protein